MENVLLSHHEACKCHPETAASLSFSRINLSSCQVVQPSSLSGHQWVLNISFQDSLQHGGLFVVVAILFKFLFHSIF
jgi:hypothetical protein